MELRLGGRRLFGRWGVVVGLILAIGNVFSAVGYVFGWWLFDRERLKKWLEVLGVVLMLFVAGSHLLWVYCNVEKFPIEWMDNYGDMSLVFYDRYNMVNYWLSQLYVNKIFGFAVGKPWLPFGWSYFWYECVMGVVEGFLFGFVIAYVGSVFNQVRLSFKKGDRSKLEAA